MKPHNAITDVMNGVQMHNERVNWVDYAKGFCIVFAAMMHSTLDVEQAVGCRMLAASRS
jgi:uncharacterized membrane protein YcfT